MKEVIVPEKYEAALEPWYIPGSFLDALNELRVPSEEPVSPEQLVNLLVKYFYVLQCPEEVQESLDGYDVACELAKFKNLVEHPDVPNNGLYAEGMLFDFCRTAGLCHEIFVSKFEDGSIIDAGTGTAVLLLIAEIASIRRQTRNRLLGFDLNQSILAKVQRVLSPIMSEITLVTADTTNVNTWKDHYFPPLALVINENLPHPGSALEQEPYLEVLISMRAAGYNLEVAQHVPDSVFATVQAREIDQPFAEFMICPTQPQEAQAYMHQLPDPKVIKAPSIFINNDQFHLRQVGASFRRFFPTPELWTQRWA